VRSKACVYGHAIGTVLRLSSVCDVT